MQTTSNSKLTRQDFVSNQEVRWCPGCGDFAILAAVQRMMPDLDIAKENIVFVSGIGCAGRFPYYMDTYGFHTIHGRAPAVATGLKITRPELSVWVVSGDGDALSIGGNHLLHALRRNLDINILLVNNRIYGLTKGQYSPTSEQGKVTNTSPRGSIEQPIDPIGLALTAGAGFVARGLDVDTKHLQTLLKQAAAHKGTSFIEIYQNCNIFNDGAFASFAERSVRAERMVYLEHGKPLIFGEEQDKAIVLNEMQPEVVELSKQSNKQELLIHNNQSRFLPQVLASMSHPDYPVPMGVFRDVTTTTYGERLQQQTAKSNKPREDLAALLKGPSSWEV